MPHRRWEGRSCSLNFQSLVGTNFSTNQGKGLMAIVLKWKAEKWHKAPLGCRLFGHYWHQGWWGSKPYLQPGSAVWDNLDEMHINLTCECSRCGKRYPVARIHASSIARKVFDHQEKHRSYLRRFRVKYLEDS